MCRQEPFVDIPEEGIAAALVEVLGNCFAGRSPPLTVFGVDR